LADAPYLVGKLEERRGAVHGRRRELDRLIAVLGQLCRRELGRPVGLGLRKGVTIENKDQCRQHPRLERLAEGLETFHGAGPSWCREGLCKRAQSSLITAWSGLCG